MRYAVAQRPVEKFDTELKLPEWQLEPDDEAMLNNPDNYYYVDDQGNLIEPGTGNGAPPPGAGAEGGPANAAPGAGLVPVNPPAANDDFLDQATGRNRPRDPSAPQPRATPREGAPPRITVQPPQRSGTVQ
jgi:penicillin-binding protein 1A